MLPAAAVEAHRRSVPASSWRDVVLTLASLRRGGGDPAHRLVSGTLWRASRTPAGLVSVALRPVAAGRVEAVAYGPGAAWLVERLPTILGLDQDWSGLDVSAVPRLQETHRRHPGLRLPSTGLVMESLVPAILEQNVTGVAARAAWRTLLYRYGEPAPPPAPPSMRVPPSAADLLAIPTWAGIGLVSTPSGSGRSGRRPASLSGSAFTAYPETEARPVDPVPGVGVNGRKRRRAPSATGHGKLGDHHLPHLVVHTLTGRPRGSDAEMLELLAPWAGQRARVMRLIELGGVMPPRFGPRLAPGRMPV